MRLGKLKPVSNTLVESYFMYSPGRRTINKERKTYVVYTG